VIRGIIFDCFGVLYHGSLGHLRELTPIEKLQEMNDLSHASDRGYISHDDYFSQVGELIGRSKDEVKKIIQQNHVRNEPMIEQVRLLKGSHKTALLSNVGYGVIQGLFSDQELRELFDVVVLSSDVKMAKPDMEIFQYVAARLDLAPAECLMVDDLTENIDGAIMSGMQGILCADTQQCISDINDALVLDSRSSLGFGEGLKDA